MFKNGIFRNVLCRQIINYRNVNSGQLRLASTHKVVGTFGETTEVLDEDKKYTFTEVHSDKQKPLVILFGWAGSSMKNLSKYGQVYREYGCSTVEYILPTRFIFRHSEQAFQAVSEVFTEVEKHKDRKTIVHCLSDTGVLTFQGLTIAAEMQDKEFAPSGIVWDSCLGPRPNVTMPRMVILIPINWMSRMRDGMSLSQAVISSATDFRDLGWKNFIRRLQGLETKISCMNDIWVGYWARDLKTDVPELIIYSKSDVYVPYKHIETEMLPNRDKNSRSLAVCKLDKSSHVSHLLHHRDTYVKHIHNLVDSVQHMSPSTKEPKV